jgi:hypothetical protein
LDILFICTLHTYSSLGLLVYSYMLSKVDLPLTTKTVTGLLLSYFCIVGGQNTF